MIYLLLCVLLVHMLVIYLALRVLGKVMRSRDAWRSLAIKSDRFIRAYKKGYITTLRQHLRLCEEIGIEVPDGFESLYERSYDEFDGLLGD
jgi:hypothetical protein